MKKFCSILLSVLFAVALLLVLLLFVIRSNVSYAAVTELAGRLLVSDSRLPGKNAGRQESGLFYPGQKEFVLAQYDMSVLNGVDLDALDISSMNVSEIVQVFLDAYDVDVKPEFIADVLATPEVSDFVEQYMGEVVDYMTGAKAEIEVNVDNIKAVLNKSFDMYEEYSGEVVDRTGIDEAVEESVEVMLPELTASLDSVKKENARTFGAIKKVESLLSLKAFVLCIGACVLLAIAILILNRGVFAMLRYISIPAMADGVLIFVASVACAAVLPSALQDAIRDAGLPGGVYEVAAGFAADVLRQLKACGIVTALCGVVLCALGFSLGRKKSA